MSQFVASGGWSIGASASTSVLPKTIQCWAFRIDLFDLLAIQGTLKSLLQHHSSKASEVLRGLIKIQTPDLLMHKVQSGTQEHAFLASSQWCGCCWPEYHIWGAPSWFLVLSYESRCLDINSNSALGGWRYVASNLNSLGFLTWNFPHMTVMLLSALILSEYKRYKWPFLVSLTMLQFSQNFTHKGVSQNNDCLSDLGPTRVQPQVMLVPLRSLKEGELWPGTTETYDPDQDMSTPQKGRNPCLRQVALHKLQHQLRVNWPKDAGFLSGRFHGAQH